MTNKRNDLNTLASVTAMFVSMSLPVSTQAEPLGTSVRRRRQVCSGPANVLAGPLATGTETEAQLSFWRLRASPDDVGECGARVSVQFMDLENGEVISGESFLTSMSSGKLVQTRISPNTKLIGARVTVSPSDLKERRRVSACKETFPFRLTLQTKDGFEGNAAVFYEAWPCKWDQPGR